MFMKVYSNNIVSYANIYKLVKTTKSLKMKKDQWDASVLLWLEVLKVVAQTLFYILYLRDDA